MSKSTFEDYGEPFEKSDSVAAYIVFNFLFNFKFIYFKNVFSLKDYDTIPNSLVISFSKNGVDMGIAFTIPIKDITLDFEESIVFFPHILSKNMVFEVNFGQRVSLLGDEPFAPLKPNFDLIQKLALDKRVRGEVAPKEKKDCEVIMLIGLPGAGKTYWATEYRKKFVKKQYNILGISSVIDKMKVN